MSVLEGSRGHKRRTSNLKGEKRRSVIISLLIRDGLNCSRCGGPFTQTERPSLDHLTPRVIGGGDDQVNLTLSHERCNALASNPPLGRRRTKADGVVDHSAPKRDALRIDEP
jgi:5-methylcytosine-specific restriction endonuclease McrA